MLAALLVVCLAFAAGFLVRGNAGLLQRLGFDTQDATNAPNPGLTVSGSTFDSLSARIAEMQGILEQQSLDAYDLEDATAKLISAASEAADDPYVRYYDTTRYAAYLTDISGSYSDVGILFSEKSDQAYAVEVYPGSEAETKGVQAGDFVVAIDGDRGNDGRWTQAEVVKAVSREEGASVVVTWRRPATVDADGGPEYTVTLTCSSNAAANVRTELSNHVGYIKLGQVTQNAGELIAQAVQGLEERGAQSYVLDVRDNPGGFLTQAVDVVSVFMKSGVVVGIQTKDALATRSATGAQVTEAPLVVLVNENTAGTAEVIAAALKDNGRAQIVGMATQGKGSVQSIARLSWGGALRYTTALYKTPHGADINRVGVNPDVQVASPTEDSETDTQKTLAIQAAASLIAE